MKFRIVGTALGAALVFHLSFVMAASPVIGTVTADGAFRLDNATVRGNATLFEGTRIETRRAGSSAQLSTGAAISLAAGSEGRFFGDHMILERGQGELKKGAGYRLEARGLRIQPETPNAAARVALSGTARVEVSALTGSFRVLNAQGVAVANLAAGAALAFEPQTPSSAAQLSGCLIAANGHYLLTDETTNVTVELGGPGLGKEAGNRVQATGTTDPDMTPAPEASQFIHVSGLKRLGKSCASRTAGAAAGAASGGAAGHGGTAGAAGAGSAAGGAGTGLGIGTTVAIIGGVAAAATVGGLAASGHLSGQTSGTISR